MSAGHVTIVTVPKRREPNMPSLARVLEVLGNRDFAGPRSGMDVAPAGSVRITGRTCPTMGRDDDIGTHDVCPLSGTDDCPADTSACTSC